MVSEQRIRDIIAGVADPVTGRDLLSSGRLDGLVVEQNRVIVTLAVPAPQAAQFDSARKVVEAAINDEAAGSMQTVQVILTAAHEAGNAPASPHGKPQMPNAQLDLPNIKHIIAVASGKGGVGKSTTAANLAAALQSLGYETGLLDADIYGPSVPTLLRLAGKPEGEQGKIIPPVVNGLKAMSIGLLIDNSAPLIWRGPMVQTAITQLLRDVVWGNLDMLVIDLPPGTGDAQLTLVQKVKLAGAVIVSTPQDLALIDATKALNMFRKVEVPVLGIVENMSQFICPHCGGASDIFGHGGARHEAEALGVPFLGELPLDMQTRLLSDEGRPVVWAMPDSDMASRYRAMAQAVAAGLEEKQAA